MKVNHKDTFKSFGLAIFDECHHLGAEIFQKCMSKVQSKYMLDYQQHLIEKIDVQKYLNGILVQLPI